MLANFKKRLDATTIQVAHIKMFKFVQWQRGGQIYNLRWMIQVNTRKHFFCGFDPDCNFIFRHRTGTFAEADFMQFKVVKVLKACELECVGSAIQRAAVHNQNPFGVLGFQHQIFDTAADASQAGHLRRALARELTRDPVGNFARVGATRAGIDDGGLFWQTAIILAHKTSFVNTLPISHDDRLNNLTQVN